MKVGIVIQSDIDSAPTARLLKREGKKKKKNCVNIKEKREMEELPEKKVGNSENITRS